MREVVDVYKLREVFSRGMPTVTYVDREHLGLERSLRTSVAKGHAIIAVTGPSKCGKTVLRRTVIPDNVVAKVEGGQVATEDDFWERIRSHLGAASARSVSATRQTGGSAEINAQIGPSFAKVGARFGESDGSGMIKTESYGGAQKGILLGELLSSNDVLVIDDFHYIPEKVRASIVRAMKSAVFEGLSVVMLSVPYRAFDVLSAEAEMEGRFSHLPIPTWDAADLLRIAVQGFPAMGLVVDGSIQEMLAREAMGSPLLMQSLCAELCAQLDVTSTQEPRRTIQATDTDTSQLFATIARDFGLPAFEKLSAGPQSRRDRIPRLFANGASGDIYEAVLAAVAYSGASEEITYDELRSALRDVLANAIPQKNEVTRSIQQMCEIARSMQAASAQQRDPESQNGEGNGIDIPAVDWKDERLFINDVFLRFYLRWVHRPSVAPLGARRPS